MRKSTTLLKLAYTLSILWLSIACFCFTAHAQIIWQNSFGGSLDDYAQSLQQTTDGGYVLAGRSESNDGDVSGNHGGDDFWIVKLDGSGNLQWQNSLGGSGSDIANSIRQTTDGGFVVAGQSWSNDGDVSGNHGDGDFWIVKLDSAGSLQWQKSFGGSDSDWAESIQQTTDGGYIVGGWSESNDGDVSGNYGLDDYWVVKLDSAGSMQWEKNFGGSYFDYANSIQQTSDGGYAVAGQSWSNDGDVIGSHGDYDYWIVKMDSSGNLQWQKPLGGSDADWARSMQQTTDGGYVIAGYSESNDGDVTGNHGEYDYWILKLDSVGNLLWQKNYGGSSNDFPTSIQQTNDGGYAVAGYSWSDDGDISSNHGGWDYWILKLDGFGELQWQLPIGGSEWDRAQSIQQTSDGDYIVGGWSESNDGDVTGNHGLRDYWIVKFQSPPVGIPSASLFEHFALFPNPVSGQLHLELELTKSQDLMIEIVNVLGEKVYTESIEAAQEFNRDLDLTRLADGVYFIKFQAGRNTYTEKIIVTK